MSYPDYARQAVRQNENDADLLASVGAITGTRPTYGLWLATRNSVLSLYGGTPDTLNAYRPSGVILSDLGPDGALYAFEKLPIPIHQDKS